MKTKLQLMLALHEYKGAHKETITKIFERLPDNYELYYFSPKTLIAEMILDYTSTSAQYDIIYNIIEGLTD